MDRVWASAEAVTVRTVFEDLATDRKIAYTTVMTVLDKLHRKGWLARTMVDRAYLYRPVHSREAYSADLMREALSDSHNSPGTLVAFLDKLTKTEARQLRAALDQSSSAPSRSPGKRARP